MESLEEKWYIFVLTEKNSHILFQVKPVKSICMPQILVAKNTSQYAQTRYF